MDTPGVVEHVNVLKYQPMRMLYVTDPEPIQPFPLDQRVERFNYGQNDQADLRADALGDAEEDIEDDVELDNKIGRAHV